MKQPSKENKPPLTYTITEQKQHGHSSTRPDLRINSHESPLQDENITRLGGMLKTRPGMAHHLFANGS